MKRIQLGKSDLMVSQIALGCMGLGGEWDAKIPLTKSDEVAAIKAAPAASQSPWASLPTACTWTWTP